MIRRVLIIASALVLALVGGVLTYTYASSADSRAAAGMQPANVLVVAEPVPAGASVADVADAVRVAELPGVSIVPGAIATMTDLASLEDLVTTAALEPGEQVLTSRFAPAGSAAAVVQVPEGMHTIALQLETRRVIGGAVRAGDHVAVFVSEAGGEPGTSLMLHRVLVVGVVGGVVTTTAEDGSEATAPTGETVTITLAVEAAQAQQLVYATEYELIYLSVEPADAPTGDMGVETEVVR